MGTINLYRVTGSGDDKTTSDRIDFNIPGSKPKVENAFIKSMERLPTDGIGNNQGAETPSGDQSALGEVENTLIIRGYISKRNGDNNDGLNTYLIKLDEWENEDKEIDDVWELGRMGIDVADNHAADLIPVRAGSDQKAYLWERIEYKTNFNLNREEFTLYLRVNRGDGT